MDRDAMRKNLLKLIRTTAKMSMAKIEVSGCYSRDEIIQAANFQSTGNLATFFAILNEAGKIAATL